jgi:hypothetical protein
MRQQFTFIAVLALLSACGGGGGGDSTVATSSGVFVNSPTKGIKYLASPSGLTGTTDENGTYSYKAGDTVTFSLDLGGSTVTLGSTSSPSATTSILALTVPNGGDPVAVAQVLETLDKSTVDGKMDVSGISLSTGTTLTKITDALKSKSVTSTDIATIASGVQTALTSTNTGTLKYGSTGVTQNDALTNLSKNSANQSLVETKIKNLTYDGTSTVLNIQDKPAFTNWIVKNGTKVEFTSRFGQLTSSGLAYDFRTVYDRTLDYSVKGTYSLSSDKITGSWIASDTEKNTGTLKMISGDTKSFAIVYENKTTGETGSISGTYLLPVTINDVKGKYFIIYKGCSNGTDNTVFISSIGVASDTCGSNVNGATFSAGPYTNTLQFVETSGARHYLGITRLNKGVETGNLPLGAFGTFMDISSSNYQKQSDAISFYVVGAVVAAAVSKKDDAVVTTTNTTTTNSTK